MVRQRGSRVAVAPPVEFSQHGPGVSIVVMRGEHDLSTRDDVQEALTRACVREAVLVDLGRCSLLDSSCIGVLVSAYESQRARDGRLALVLPAEGSVNRTLQLTGVDRIIPSHLTREACLEAFLSDGHVMQIRDLRERIDAPACYRAFCACGWRGEARSGSRGERLARREGHTHIDTQRRARARFRPGSRTDSP